MSRPRGFRGLALAAAAGLTLTALPAWAGAPTERLRDFFAAVNAVLANPTTEAQPLERVERVRRLVAELGDVRDAAAAALGREWHARTPAEQAEFLGLFAALLERAYVARLAGAVRVTGGVEVEYLGESGTADEAVVHTTLVARDGGRAAVDFRMVRRGPRWLVRDLVLDGVSTVENYHAQFQRMVRTGSFRGLVATLRAKLADESAMFAAAQAPAAAQAAASAPAAAPASVVSGKPPPATALADDVRAPAAEAIERPVIAAVLPPLAPPAEGRDGAGPAALQAGPTPPAPGAVPPVAPAPAAPVVRAPEPPAPPAPPALSRPTPAPVVRAPEPRVEPAWVAEPALAAAPPAPPRAPIATHAWPNGAPAAPTPGAARPAPPLAPTADDPLAGYWIQVGAFRDGAAAGRLAALLDGEIFLSPVARPSPGVVPLLRVRVGPFAERARAVARLRELEALGYRPFITAEH
jgi:ABC-type transporter MlaC component/cell division septation protein DedD